LTLRLIYDNYEKHYETGRTNQNKSRVLIAKKLAKTKMKRSTTNRFLANSLRTLCCIGALTACSAWATVITWQLNPTAANGDAGATSLNFTQSGYTITADGYDNVPGADTPHELYFKNLAASGGGSERGLGLVGTLDNELQTSGGTPSNYIQLDLRSILSQGFTGLQISVGSIQPGESFLLFGSNTQGTLGTQIGGAYGSTFDDQFVDITGNFQFISVAAGALDILPVALRGTITPVPEMSTLFPIVGLIAAVSCTHILRRRRAAQKTVSIV
jgi:hypothetical protein